MADVTERERFDFEREKWRADLEMRARDVAVKERDQASSKWRSPITVAILAAAAAAFGNAIVAIVNGTQQVAVENSKAESARILEMIKTGNPEAAASNLDFLLKSGLITDAERVAKLRGFLAERKPGTGPSLPPASQFRFEATEPLAPDIQKELDKRLDDFVSYMKGIGFPEDRNKPTIKIDKMSRPWAYYDPKTNLVVIDASLVGDPSVVLHEYAHRVLIMRGGLPQWMPRRAFARLESGIADYLVGSFLQTPKIEEGAARGSAFVRSLDKHRKFQELADATDDFSSIHSGAEIWGGALWEIRQLLRRDVADPIIVQAWHSVTWPQDDAETPVAFTTALLAAVRQKAPTRADEVTAILQSRAFPLAR